MIFAVASLIGQEKWQNILELLPESREIIKKQKNNEFAHISWMVSQQMDVSKVEKALKSISKDQKPLAISSGGLGIFCGENPVITLQLARNSSVNTFHSRIWKKCGDCMGDVKPYCSPDVWMPHVTLMHHGFDAKMYMEFLLKSIYSPVQIDIPITNLTILFQDNDIAGKLVTFDFKDMTQNENYPVSLP
jgi:hypothetical protein